MEQITVYIKINSTDGHVSLAGTVATEQMLAEGYVPYSGEVPFFDASKHEYLVFNNGVLTVVSDELNVKKDRANWLTNQLDITRYREDSSYAEITDATVVAGHIEERKNWRLELRQLNTDIAALEAAPTPGV